MITGSLARVPPEAYCETNVKVIPEWRKEAGKERSQYRYATKQASNVGNWNSTEGTQGDNVEHASELPGPPVKTQHHWLRAALGALSLAFPVYLMLGMTVLGAAEESH